jgi:hypothetical protein
MELTSRLLPADVLRLGSIGLRTRRLRAALSAVGIAIGIASMVAVLGISQSSKADLLAQLDKLGTNLLTITPGETLLGDAATLPLTAPKMVARLDPVDQVATERTTGATVRRTNYIPAAQTNGISVLAADTNLLAPLNGTIAQGVFLNAANIRYPAVVLGSVAPERLAITSLKAGPMIYFDGRWFSVVGILNPLPLAPDIDRAALVGYPIAQQLLGAERDATTIYVRTDPDTIDDTRTLLPAAANPENPEEVAVSRPSDVLEARAAGRDRLHLALSRPRRRRPPGRRRRHRQRHGHLRPRTPLRDRAAPRARRRQTPHLHPVPQRVAAARGGRRPRRRPDRRARHRRLRPHPRLGGQHPRLRAPRRAHRLPPDRRRRRPLPRGTSRPPLPGRSTADGLMSARATKPRPGRDPFGPRGAGRAGDAAAAQPTPQAAAPASATQQRSRRFAKATARKCGSDHITRRNRP